MVVFRQSRQLPIQVRSICKVKGTDVESKEIEELYDLICDRTESCLLVYGIRPVSIHGGVSVPNRSRSLQRSLFHLYISDYYSI